MKRPDDARALYATAQQWKPSNRCIWQGLANLEALLDPHGSKALGVYERAIECEALPTLEKDAIYQAYLLLLTTKGSASRLRAVSAQQHLFLRGVSSNERKRQLPEGGFDMVRGCARGLRFLFTLTLKLTSLDHCAATEQVCSRRLAWSLTRCSIRWCQSPSPASCIVWATCCRSEHTNQQSVRAHACQFYRVFSLHICATLTMRVANQMNAVLLLSARCCSNLHLLFASGSSYSTCGCKCTMVISAGAKRRIGGPQNAVPLPT